MYVCTRQWATYINNLCAADQVMFYAYSFKYPGLNLGDRVKTRTSCQYTAPKTERKRDRE